MTHIQIRQTNISTDVQKGNTVYETNFSISQIVSCNVGDTVINTITCNYVKDGDSTAGYGHGELRLIKLSDL